ncbi:MAG: alpha/beta hydrolase, partial [Bacillota bacterium]
MKINVNGINLYCEIHGSGEPLLLIEGFGYSSWMWYRQVPELSKHYQLIVFDNRGVGESDKPDVPYSIEMMADDAAGL